MSDPDRNAWRDLDLIAEMNAEAAQMAPPDGARARVLQGLMAGVAATALAEAGMAATQGLTGTAAAGTTAAGTTVAGTTAGTTAATVTAGTVAAGTAAGGGAAVGGGLLLKGALALALLGGGTAVTLHVAQPDAPTSVRELQPDTPARHPSPALTTSTTGRGARVVRAPQTASPAQPPSVALLVPLADSTPESAAPTGPDDASAIPMSTRHSGLRPRVRASASSSRRRAARRSPVRTDEAMRAEVQLISAARTGLRRGKLDVAQRALRTHARQFARGQHAEERLALEIVLLHQQGKTEVAQTRWTTFQKRFPRSVHARLVRAMLAR